jgi:fermentation-respiration switch protein FrsA (DUF1100 family)
MFVPEVAEQFQLVGITALIYDPRSIGASDGLPRQEIDPMKQVEDFSDALTFMSSLPIVDSSRIGFWGMSLSASVALCASALDKRAKFIIAICPLVSLDYGTTKFSKVLTKVMKDRESQTKGSDPFYLPLLSDNGVNPAGLGLGMDKENFEYIVRAKETVAPAFENRCTIQTYYKMIMWQPMGLMPYVAPTPVLFIVPELDTVSPAKDQVSLFTSLSQPKKVHIAPGKGHLNVMSGEDFPFLMKLQVDWVVSVLEGALTED